MFLNPRSRVWRIRTGNRRGSDIVEFAILAPWFIFLFVGALDFGFYSYALIATQNAARVAALYCSGSSSLAEDCSAACGYALDQLRNLPNVPTPTSTSTCTASPVVVTTSVRSGPDSTDSVPTSESQVQVTYTTPELIPIPGLLPGSITISRTAFMRVMS
jgi:Flp pilus assembly protein TadG